jgi:hypothetical protein
VKYVIAALAGVVGLALGWVVAAFGFLIIGGMIGVSDFEGQRPMLAFFAVGPVGGVVGLVAGAWLALHKR